MLQRKRLPGQRRSPIPDEDRYALATAAGGVAVWDWDLATNDLFVDPVLRSMLGYEDNSVPDRIVDWARLVHPEDRDRLLKDAQTCLVPPSKRFECEHRMLARSGNVRWFLTRGSAIYDQNGKAIRVLGTTTDVTERKLAQLALRESDARFLQLAENIPQIFWLMSADMQRLLYISPAYEEITGRTCDALYSDSREWMAAVHPEDRPGIFKAYEERQSGKRTGRTEVEYRYVRPDGSIRWMHATIFPVLDDSSGPYRISGVAHDVTERKHHEELLRRSGEELALEVERQTMELTAAVRRLEQEIAERARAEEALRHSEFRFRRLFESNIIGAMIADVHGHIVEANEELLKMIGYSKADLPLRWDKLTPPEWSAIDEGKARQIIKEGVATPYEKEYFRKDGTRVPIYLGAALLDSNAGTCIAFVVDQTESKQAERQLRDSESRFRRLFESNIIGAMICDIHGEILHVNDAILKIIGYSPEDLPLRWDKMTPPEWRYTDERALEQLAQNGIAPPWEKEYIRKDGSRVPILLGVAMLSGAECIAFVLDLTDLKQAQAEIQGLNAHLEHASRLSMMGETVAALAHEVHQPLAAMANYANGTIRRLQQREATVEEITKRLSEIATESMRAADVLRRVRQFLQLREPKYELASINTIVQDALKLVRLDREAHQVEIVFKPKLDLPLFSMDSIQMTQVTLNLVLNGIQSMTGISDRDRRVTIETALRDGGFVEVSVTDTGHGVPAEVQSRIFEQFFTTKPDGLGMGLSISRSIVEAHGGRLWCETGKSGNTVFRYSLPARRKQLESAPDEEGDATQVANIGRQSRRR